MDRSSLFATLSQRLQGLPEAEIKKVTDYYNEMIEDRMEDGYSEEDAIAALGPVDELVEHTLYDQSIPHLLRANVRPRGEGLSTGRILLLVLSSPIWLPILALAVALFIAAAAVLIAVVAAISGALLAMGVGAIASTISSVVYLVHGSVVPAIFAFGAALVMAGMVFLLVPYVAKVGRWYVEQMHRLIRFVKKPFVKKLGGRI